jgi:L,D-transpeptidase ErfK/SrfK
MNCGDAAGRPEFNTLLRRRTAVYARFARMRGLERKLFALCVLTCAPTVHGAEYRLADSRQSVIGDDQTITTVYEDTLYDLARRYGVGSEELIRVNAGLDPWVPGADKQVLIPGRHILPSAPREGIVVNLPEHRLYYYPKPTRGGTRRVITYPVSIGRLDSGTPLGLTHVISKQKDPTWIPTASIRAEHVRNGDPLPPSVPPGPANPLGQYRLRLGVGNGTYLIHGTNNPIAVGLPVTHGCVRMYPEDVAALFPLVPVGTPVRFVNEPVKLAWVDGELLLEAHPPVDLEGRTIEPDLEAFADMLRAAVGDDPLATNWDYAQEVLQRANGALATVGLDPARSVLSMDSGT